MEKLCSEDFTKGWIFFGTWWFPFVITISCQWWWVFVIRWQSGGVGSEGLEEVDVWGDAKVDPLEHTVNVISFAAFQSATR